MLNLHRCYASLFEGNFHGTVGTVTILGTRGHMVGICAGAITDNFSQRCCPTGQRMLQCLNHQHAGTFTHNKPVACTVKRP
ncbi:hypothetical protein D3C72_2260830 [compost metagenome]